MTNNSSYINRITLIVVLFVLPLCSLFAEPMLMEDFIDEEKVSMSIQPGEKYFSAFCSTDIFLLPEEAYIDDIPFSTYEMAQGDTDSATAEDKVDPVVIDSKEVGKAAAFYAFSLRNMIATLAMVAGFIFFVFKTYAI